MGADCLLYILCRFYRFISVFEYTTVSLNAGLRGRFLKYMDVQIGGSPNIYGIPINTYVKLTNI
jgi:hypothetical protein